jgi:hypothetical protein
LPNVGWEAPPPTELKLAVVIPGPNILQIPEMSWGAEVFVFAALSCADSVVAHSNAAIRIKNVLAKSFRIYGFPFVRWRHLLLVFIPRNYVFAEVVTQAERIVNFPERVFIGVDAAVFPDIPIWLSIRPVSPCAL